MLLRKQPQTLNRRGRGGKEAIHPVDQPQLLSYLRLLDLQVGLLINFHVVALKDGVKRMVNHYQDVPDDAEEAMQQLNR